MVHLVPLILYLKYRQTGRLTFLWWMLGSLPVLFLFTYNLAFTFPGVLLWGLWEGYKQRKFRGAAVAVASGLVSLALIGGIYSLTLHKASTSQNEAYWGRKYDVFYTKVQREEGQSRASWMAKKYTDMASLPGLRREVWHPPAFVGERVVQAGITADRVLWLALHLAGMAYLLVRRRELFVLLVVPYLILIVLNVVGRWPIGAFRTNVFLCVYMLPLAIFGFDWLARRSFRSAASMGAVVAAITLVPAFAFGFDIGEKKGFWGARNHEARDIIATLKQQREEHLKVDPSLGREWLLLDCHQQYSHRYYMSLHPETKAEYADYFKKNFDMYKGCSTNPFNRALKSRLRKPGRPFWVVVSKRALVEPTRRLVHGSGRVLFEKRLGSEHIVDHLMFYVEPKPQKPKATKAASPSADEADAKAKDEADAKAKDGADDNDAPAEKDAPARPGAADPEDDADDDND
jgi:hypothetical protein